MIYRKTYKVQGYDVNDMMVMQDFAYYSYASTTFYSLAFKMGYSKKKLCSLEVHLDPLWQKVQHYTPLVFTEEFSAYFEFHEVDPKGILQTRCRFFNHKNELCALVQATYHVKKEFRELFCKPLLTQVITHKELTIQSNML